MSYDYGLFKTKDDTVETLSHVTDETITSWGFRAQATKSDVKEVIVFQ